MRRRDFVELPAAVAAASTLTSSAASAAPKKPFAAKLGTQHGTTDPILKACAAFGVHNICSGLPSRQLDEKWTVESLTRLRERVESFGIKLDMVPVPLSSLPIDRVEMPNILLGRSPERDREIDAICQMLRNVARAGIPAVKYNMSILGVNRIEPTTGRGGARYSTFNYDKLPAAPEAVPGGVPADLYWERITYFLDRVVPVAAENKVRIACHPHDPGMPKGKGYRGVETVLGSVDGLKRFVSIRENPYHGLNFCQGTVSEMLQDPKREILDVIRFFGSRKKIFNVHFRNIQGKFLDFRETFPDDGDVDMLAALRVYRDVGYDGMLMPDHVPRIDVPEGNAQAFAFAFGYIRALMQAVAAE